MFLDENLVILSYQTSWQHKSNVFLQFVSGELRLTSLVFVLQTVTQYSRSCCKSEEFVRSSTICIHSAEKDTMLKILATYFKCLQQPEHSLFKKNDLWASGIYTHCLESVEESIWWFMAFRKLDALKQSCGEYGEQAHKDLQICARIIAFVIKQWKGFSS